MHSYRIQNLQQGRRVINTAHWLSSLIYLCYIAHVSLPIGIGSEAGPVKKPIVGLETDSIERPARIELLEADTTDLTNVTMETLPNPKLNKILSQPIIAVRYVLVGLEENNDTTSTGEAERLVAINEDTPTNENEPTVEVMTHHLTSKIGIPVYTIMSQVLGIILTTTMINAVVAWWLSLIEGIISVLEQTPDEDLLKQIGAFGFYFTQINIGSHDYHEVYNLVVHHVYWGHAYTVVARILDDGGQNKCFCEELEQVHVELKGLQKKASG